MAVIEEMKDQPLQLPPEYHEEALQLRNKLLLWRFRTYDALSIEYYARIPGLELRINGDCRGRLLQRGQHWSCGDNHVHLHTDQLGGQTAEALGPVLTPARLGHKMLSIHVAELAQSAQECVDGWVPRLGPGHIGGRPLRDDPDPRDLTRGLGGGGAGPRERNEGKAGR
jgi:hypothetical protein